MHILACALLAAPLPLPAQDAWTAWISRLQERGTPGGAWLLVLRPQDAAGRWWLQDDGVRRLLATREFQVQVLTEPQGRDLSQQKGWRQEPRWLLFAPEGGRQAEGGGRPTGDRLLAGLQELGFTPRWARRGAFLQAHPEHGPARVEALQEAELLLELRMAAVAGGADGLQARLRAQPPDPSALAWLEAQALDLTEALQALARIPGWWEQGASPLRRWNARADLPLPPVLGDTIARLRDQVRGELEQDPGEEDLWSLWSRLALLTGQDLQAALAAVIPAPGQAWPPDGLVAVLAEGATAKEDWAGLLRAMDALKTAAGRDPADRDAWDEARIALATVEVHRARALARLGRWEESAGAVGEARFLAGQRWRGFLSFAVRRGIPEAFGERKAVFQPYLDGDPLPDPPMPPARPRLRLLRLGAPAWADAWAALARSAELAPWGPGEWSAEPAPAELERSLRAHHGWSGPRWALLAGTDLLASGETVPAARDLAQRLAQLAPSRLMRLDRFLEQHPGHRVARRMRVDLLRGRMPNRTLEPLLAEDARLLLARVKAGADWSPDPALWQWAAGRVLPALEAELERWPEQVERWRDWVAWARLHPRQPSALALARRLPLYGMDSAWASRLPAEVHRAVAEELRVAGRFEEQRQWFADAWSGLDQGRRRGRLPEWLRTLRRSQKEAIVDPLREALVVLRRDPELLALDRAVAAWLGEEAP